MQNDIRTSQEATVSLYRDSREIPVQRCRAKVASGIGMRGLFVVEHWRGGARFNEYQFRNDIVDEGKDKLLNVMFDNSAQIALWHLGIIDDSNFSALDSNDTYANIDLVGNGWDEFKSYTDANNGGSATTRPVWQVDPAASQVISNTATSIYDITGAGVIKGLFVVGGGTSPELKGDNTAGSVIWATALFTVGDVTVKIGDQLKVIYTVSA